MPHACMRCVRGGAQSGFLDSFPFDPAGLNSDTNQTKELKNGRLAVRSLILPLTLTLPRWHCGLASQTIWRSSMHVTWCGAAIGPQPVCVHDTITLAIVGVDWTCSYHPEETPACLCHYLAPYKVKHTGAQQT